MARRIGGRIEAVFGERLRALREERALTQAALARAAGLSQGNLARIENGDRSPTLGSLAKLARALGLTLAELVEPSSERVPTPKAEKAWFRVCGKLRERDEHFLRAVEHLIRALDTASR